jgi:hypothetical protein
MSYYDKYIKYKKKYLSFANKISGGAGNIEGEQEELKLKLANYKPIDGEQFQNKDVYDFTVPLNNVRANIPENTRELVDILDKMYSVVVRSSGVRFTISQLNGIDNNSKNYNQLYNLTLALYNYYDKILFNQGIIGSEALLITNIIKTLTTPTIFNSLTTVEKYLLGGLRSLYNTLNERLPTKSTREPPPSESIPAQAPPPASSPASTESP